MVIQYQYTGIKNYAYWKREDGLAFDPWLKVHDKIGGEILKTLGHILVLVFG